MLSRKTIELAIEAIKMKFMDYCDFFDPNIDSKKKIVKVYKQSISELEAALKEQEGE